MNRRHRRGAALLCLALALCASVHAQAARDPFAPVALRAELMGTPTTGKPGSPATAAPAAAAEVPWKVSLRGVMVDGSHSLANVEGVLLALGQTLDGHRLVAVREGEAEFTHDGHPVVLRLPTSEESRKP